MDHQQRLARGGDSGSGSMPANTPDARDMQNTRNTCRASLIRPALRNKLHAALGCALLCGSLSGCAGIAGMMGTPVQAYEGPTLPDSAVATLLKTPPGTYPSAFLSKVDDITYGDEGFRGGYPAIVKVLPGRHKITVICYAGRRRAFPSVLHDFEPGQTYTLGCGEMSNNMAGAYVLHQGPTAAPAAGEPGK